ncbi:hypothetical protein KM043_011168 [Ampulex compressa]|nr:hypothetical protein KM043_011168 [Ampulex compressa]
MECEHDQTFLEILRQENNVTNFLDAFFGFLYRCTDFYVESSTEQKLGFPPGVAEKLILNGFHKWKDTYTRQNEINSFKNHEHEQDIMTNSEKVEDVLVSPPMNEVEIETSISHEASSPTSIKCSKVRVPSDSYNGAVRENYAWSQTISDLNVLVQLPNSIKSTKDIKVDLSAKDIKIQIQSIKPIDNAKQNSNNPQWTTILEGDFCFNIHKDESTWSILPGQEISIHLEKASERWWDALIIGEPKIDLSKIDCSKNFYEMGSAEQMKIQELMWNHQQKLSGKPTSTEIEMEKILKKAWNAKGSPFEGTPYDPSVLHFN